MTYNVLQSLKEIFSLNGAKTKTTEREPGPAQFSGSEIDYLRQQVKQNSQSALKIRQARGNKVNPRIQAARAAGSKV